VQWDVLSWLIVIEGIVNKRTIAICTSINFRKFRKSTKTWGYWLFSWSWKETMEARGRPCRAISIKNPRERSSLRLARVSMLAEYNMPRVKLNMMWMALMSVQTNSLQSSLFSAMSQCRRLYSRCFPELGYTVTLAPVRSSKQFIHLCDGFLRFRLPRLLDFFGTSLPVINFWFISCPEYFNRRLFSRLYSVAQKRLLRLVWSHCLWFSLCLADL